MLGILNHQNLINICFVLQGDNEVQNNVQLPIYFISFRAEKLCSQEAELTGSYSNLAKSKERKGNFPVLLFFPHFMTVAIRIATHLGNEIVILSFDSCNRRIRGSFSKSIVAELSLTEKQQHSVWVSRSKLPV